MMPEVTVNGPSERSLLLQRARDLRLAFRTGFDLGKRTGVTYPSNEEAEAAFQRVFARIEKRFNRRKK
jgi:hypothetical protein